MAAAGRSGHRARKRFGQHFLVDAGVVHAIVEAIAPRAGQLIVEIGPGRAALTDALLERIDSLQAIEIDRDLAARLRRHYPASQLRLHEADALDFDFAKARDGAAPTAGNPKRLRVVGNLPYNVSSPLLVRLLDFRALIDDQHFMLQKEVVDRIVAAPGSSDYGRLSVLMQAHLYCDSLFEVPPTAFDPPPRVDSAVVRMIVRRDRETEDPGPLQQLLAVAFGQRRKMLRGTLLPWLAERGVDAEELVPTARAEDIDVETWRRLAARLVAAGG
ncbi:MAG: 16S rRNA (adenine(1518)-N(6)/adenine(1519)-N(6))-dimethyltransferase RsmA [Burkholderiaceae bacterium]